ncbi:MAG: hypothetical protein P0Y66_22830 [Candidatus Kaistia colombiensis]|nr:MAG: hypothetical protein P0Y66_22830 [Kaistia sp.]
MLALSRQNLPPLRTDASENKLGQGRLRAAGAEAARPVTLFASGSEVEIAVAARKRSPRRASGPRRLGPVASSCL